MAIYVTINDQNQVGIINDSASPKTDMWFSVGPPGNQRDEVVALIVALNRAKEELAGRKQPPPRWVVK